jgi:hypothetical protein
MISLLLSVCLLQEERRRVLRKCLGRINQEVMDAAEQGVAVRCGVLTENVTGW